MRHYALLGVACLSLTLAACSTVKKGPGAEGGEYYEDGGAVASGYEGGSSFGGADYSSAFYQENPRCKPAPLSAGSDQRVFFGFDQSDVQSEFDAALRNVADYLAKNAGSKIRVEGNTDDRGSREYNIALGWRRDRAVAEYLQQHGVTQNQMELVSYGAERPLALGTSEEAYQCNRRVDIRFK